MQLQSGPSSIDIDAMKSFAKWMLDIGEGKVGREIDDQFEVEIPDDLLLSEFDDFVASIVSSTYPDLVENIGNNNFFEYRAILTPTIEAVEKINEYIIQHLPSEEKKYLSSDSIYKFDDDIGVDHEWITVEFLNEIKCSGVPNHKLKLKKGVLVMLLRNIDQAARLCNGIDL